MSKAERPFSKMPKSQGLYAYEDVTMGSLNPSSQSVQKEMVVADYTDPRTQATRAETKAKGFSMRKGAFYTMPR